MTLTVHRIQTSAIGALQYSATEDTIYLNEEMTPEHVFATHDMRDFMHQINYSYLDAKTNSRYLDAHVENGLDARFLRYSALSDLIEINHRPRSHGSSLWNEQPRLDYLSLATDFRTRIAMEYLPKFSKRLNQHSCNRLAMFIECKDGWDGDDAKAFSLSSLQKCANFISEYDLRDKEIGLFMDTDGSLVLNWPLPTQNNEEQKIFEISFGESNYAIYMDDWDDRMEFEAFNDELREHLQRAV